MLYRNKNKTNVGVFSVYSNNWGKILQKLIGRFIILHIKEQKKTDLITQIKLRLKYSGVICVYVWVCVCVCETVITFHFGIFGYLWLGLLRSPSACVPTLETVEVQLLCSFQHCLVHPSRNKWYLALCNRLHSHNNTQNAVIHQINIIISTTTNILNSIIGFMCVCFFFFS